MILTYNTKYTDMTICVSEGLAGGEPRAMAKHHYKN